MTKYYARRDPEDEIAEAFRLFDRDESGRISLRVRGLPWVTCA